MIFNFITRYKIDDDQFVLLDDNGIRWQAISVMVLPGMVWLMCCLRAWQFQYLISEAEQEAQDRIRSEFPNVMSAATTSGDNETEESQQPTTATPSSPVPVVNREEELALQNEMARIS